MLFTDPLNWGMVEGGAEGGRKEMVKEEFMYVQLS